MPYKDPEKHLECLRRRRKWRRANDPEYAAKVRAQCLASRTPAMHSAIEAVRRAIKKGLLVRPNICEECGKEGVIEAAHHSYERDRRLDVRWLCRSCHRRWDMVEPKSSPHGAFRD